MRVTNVLPKSLLLVVDELDTAFGILIGIFSAG
jgi:hypothetical protein